MDAPHRRALLLSLALLIALAVFGTRVHWVEEAGSAERDDYVGKADQLLAGNLPRDPFRPLLFPILTAAAAPLAGGTFPAARGISNLSAAALAFLAFAAGRRFGGERAGWWAFAATAANPNLWILGQHVSTDALFSALAGASLLSALSYLEAPTHRAALASAAFCSLAAFTRGNAIFLLPALAVAWWLADRSPGSGGARRRHLATAATTGVALLVPHWILRYRAFGDPFHDENWKNIAWKLYGYPDWSYLESVPFAGLSEVLLHAPGRVLAGASAELARFTSEGASQLLGTPLHALFAAVGAALAIGFRRRAAGWAAFAAASFVAAVAVVFFTWGRLLLWLLPWGYALAFGGWVRGMDLLPHRPRWPGRLVSAAFAGLVLLLALKTFAFRLPAFVDRHPYREIEVLRQLEEGLAPGVALAGTSPFLGRYLGHPYVYLPDAFGAEITDTGAYFEKVRRELVRDRVHFFVVGEGDLRDRPRGLLGSRAPVPWLERHPLPEASGEGAAESPEDGALGEGVAVWRVLLEPEVREQP